MQKNIIKLEHPRQSHMVWDGFRVSQYIPGYSREMSPETSPFLMLDYNRPWIISPQENHRPGVGFHPHRGFETVTIVYSWEIEHQDTAGNGWVIGPDEVQWMTAWSGLLHNEFMTERFSRRGGMQHAVQLWIDLPQEFKMTQPKYQALTRESIPEVEFDGGKVRVIAGEFKWIKWIAKTHSPVELYDILFQGTWKNLEFTLPAWYNTMILIVEWSAQILEKTCENWDMITLSHDGETINIASLFDHTRLLIMSGKPLAQTVVQHGPFVMNTIAEIHEAIDDFRSWKMG
jgi:redox-sensitive bicupin YhaK (pirin superfamily)